MNTYELQMFLFIFQPDASFSTLVTNNITLQKEIVGKFNEIRRHVNPTASNMLRMAWNSEAASNAKKWAEKCTMTTSPPEERRIKNTTCSENYYMSSSPKSWSETIQKWYGTVSEFSYGTRTTRRGAPVNLYSQMVSANTHQIGCAAAFCPDSEFHYLYVCHYYPPRNSLDSPDTPYAKGTPCAECPDSCDNGLCSKKKIFLRLIFNIIIIIVKCHQAVSNS
uniref:SCP domain-containing protein n=1 Tax=Ornithorhynchus anatinus TaxID=9258 RepID=K7EC76_ORNAN